MLNRRILRVKVMQSLYAFFQAEDTNLAKAEKELLLSVNRIYDLFLHFLILPIELANIAEVQMEEARNKALPSEDDINPNRKFIDSFMLTALKDNSKLQDLVESNKVSWSNYQDELRKLWKEIKASALYQDFLKEEDSTSSHRKFFEKLYTNFIIDQDLVYSCFQERSIYWDFEDCDFAGNMALRYISKIKGATQYKVLPEIYKDPEEDLDFVKSLFRKTINYNKENAAHIEAKTKNWEMDRIAVLDVLFMKMAITEFLYFSSIPVKVTLNEYIELAKLFSSPKSKVFINGVLDKLLIEFNTEKKIKKTGRGLLQ